MEFPAAPPDEAGPARPGPMKFTYPSGSRPLDGYTIKRGVGRGGFGEVYYGTSDGGKEVALKLIRRNLEVELRGVRHCLNLKHPHLVALYDIKTDEHDDRWVVMEYVSGESLEDAIERNPNGMPEAEILNWMKGVCAGVAYLHDQGIVHRDLKPGNIFSDEGVVKIGDYGLSKFISCSRRSGQTESVGTVHYMAPEIANGRYGKEIDTYALGIILYEMLTGRVPFEGESVGEVLMKHLTAEPDLNALSGPYRTIVERALAKDPQRRFKSVHEMAAMLPGNGVGAAATYMPPAEKKPPHQPRTFDNLSSREADAAFRETEARVEAFNAQASATESDREPIWAAIKDALANVSEAWREADVHPLFRAVFIIVLVIVLVYTAPAWLMFLFVSFILYGIYRVVRAMIVPSRRKRQAAALASSPATPLRNDRRKARDNNVAVTQVRDPAARQPATDPHQRETASSPQPRRHRRQHRRSVRAELTRMVAQKSMKERLTEVTGSMLLAAVIAAVTSMILLLLVTGEVLATDFVWLALVATLGSWLVMIPAKFFEGKVEDHAPKRFTQLVLGMLLGFAAWGLHDVIGAGLPFNRDLNFDEPLMQEFMGSMRQYDFHSATNVPMAMFVGYFGFLLAALRWWTQAEWTRYTRLSIWSIAVCVTIALLLQMLWWFPQPAGALVAAVMAFSIQLSSPWLSMSRRREIVQELHAA